MKEILECLKINYVNIKRTFHFLYPFKKLFSLKEILEKKPNNTWWDSNFHNFLHTDLGHKCPQVSFILKFQRVSKKAIENNNLKSTGHLKTTSIQYFLKFLQAGIFYEFFFSFSLSFLWTLLIFTIWNINFFRSLYKIFCLTIRLLDFRNDMIFI